MGLLLVSRDEKIEAAIKAAQARLPRVERVEQPTPAKKKKAWVPRTPRFKIARGFKAGSGRWS